MWVGNRGGGQAARAALAGDCGGWGSVWSIVAAGVSHAAACRSAAAGETDRGGAGGVSRLDARLPLDGDAVALARRVSRSMAENSAFRRAAMLVRDADGRFSVAAHAGMDDATVESLNAWGEGVAADERSGGTRVRRGEGGLGVRVGTKSFAVVLGKGPAEGMVSAGDCDSAVDDGRTDGGCAGGGCGQLDGRAAERAGGGVGAAGGVGGEAGAGDGECCAGGAVAQAEKLAGLGLLAGGVAHALNNPLTAVLGFAELIADTTSEGG